MDEIYRKLTATLLIIRRDQRKPPATFAQRFKKRPHINFGSHNNSAKYALEVLLTLVYKETGHLGQA